ncbi:SEC14-like protein 1 [Haliotis rubra]|uniref:SEC14-like protein 1 n=1 Tax=Haliotis rubra TaxID=36100 RepID=UPI001EE54987|nr:SEC14-like protein 1 [Haliotis rubra]
MVQKYNSPVRVYKYPFELVMAAYEKRFPTCKMIPVFLGSDILNEFRSEDGSEHVVERRCRLNVDAPYLLKKIVGVDHVIFIQKNTLNRRNRTLTIEANNESFSSRIIINENCHYSVHTENPMWTCFEQDASLDIKHFFGFESTVEKIAMKQYTQNIKKGKEVIEYYINELLSQGITYIPPWTDPKLKAVAVEDAPSQDSGLRSRSDSVSSQHSQHSQASLILGATAATIHRGSISSPESEVTEVRVPPVEPRGKLDDDYIQRFLGALTPVEESQLITLRQWLQKTHKGKIPKDAHILRFLRARDFNVEKAREMLVHSLAWRKLHNIDRLLDTYEIPPVIKRYYPGGWHYCDKEDRPLYILRMGQMDVKGLMKSPFYNDSNEEKNMLINHIRGNFNFIDLQKLIQVPQKGCVITWDFDILKGDVTFTVFRCRASRSTDPIHQHHVSSATGGIGSVQYIDKSMVVGVDISIMEPPHICRDGDSVQGTHVTSQAGSYILQWKYFDSAKASFDFPLTSHKSKVMYYTELLPSEAFRGSMSSLQSCQSGFSSLSIGTNHSSQSGASSCPSRRNHLLTIPSQIRR